MANIGTLRTLLRVRRQALDGARQHLAALLAAETAAAARNRAAANAIRREHDVAASLEADDAAVEAFALWLPEGRRAVATAEAALTEAETATGHARARLNISRAAVEAAERLLEAQTAAERADQARKLQLTLDDMHTGKPPGL